MIPSVVCLFSLLPLVVLFRIWFHRERDTQPLYAQQQQQQQQQPQQQQQQNGLERVYSAIDATIGQGCLCHLWQHDRVVGGSSHHRTIIPSILVQTLSSLVLGNGTRLRARTTNTGTTRRPTTTNATASLYRHNNDNYCNADTKRTQNGYSILG